MSSAATISVLARLVPEAEKPDGFETIRNEAEVFLSENGIPSKRHEDWKYVNVKRLFDNGLSVNELKVIEEDIPTETKGRLDLGNSVSVHVENDAIANCNDVADRRDVAFNVSTGMDGDENTDPIGTTAVHKVQELAALNTALFKDCLIVRVAKSTQAETTFLIDHSVDLKDNALANSRLLIIVEDGATANIVHHFRGENNSDRSLLNHVTEVFVGKNARLEMNIIQEIGSGNLVNTTEVVCEQDSSFTSNTVQLSGKLLRNNLNIKLKAENIETHLHGFYMLSGKELFDNHTVVDHLKPNCQSNEIYRGLLAGRSTGVFNGKVFVHRDAQKTDAFQKNNNILLSDDATMNSKPELEIYADDVKCSHGSTTGQLDEEAVFYLRTRGLDEFGATALLLNAFATEVLEKITDDELRAILEGKIQNKLKEMRVNG